MINLKHLINFLPHYFKATDTYKDNEGRGILERFLEISGEYLEEYITPDIESTLDLLDIDKTKTIYLNYLWEFLGEIPFAYGGHIDKEKWDLYNQNYDNPEELARLAKEWEVIKTGPIVLDEGKVRDILKYSITLLKIRGTKRFFELIFRLYGMECTITDPTDNKDANFWKKATPRFDEDICFDKKRHNTDISYSCTPCIVVNIDVRSEQGLNQNSFRGNESTVFGGKNEGLIDDQDAINDYNNLGPADKVIHYSNSQVEYENENQVLLSNNMITPSYEEFRIFREMMDKFFYRFLPYNVIPHLTFQGLEVDDNITVSDVQFIKPNQKDLDNIGNNKVGLKTEIHSNWKYTQKKYRVSYAPSASEKFSRPGPPHLDSEVFYAYKPGIYRFIALEDSTKYKDIEVKSKVDNKAYNIELVNSIPSSLTITPDSNVKVLLKATLTYQGKVTPCRIRARGYDAIKNSEEYWEISEPGVYQFEIVEFPVKFYTLKVNKVPNVYKIHCNPPSIDLKEIDGILKATTVLTVEDNYRTPGLTISNVATGEVFNNGDTFTAYNSGIYTFKCTQDKSSNPSKSTFIVRPQKEIQYGIKVSPEVSIIGKPYEGMGRTYVKCSLIKGEPSTENLDFRVGCMETGEIFLAGPTASHRFESNTPGLYHFESLADNTVKAQWLLKEYQTPHDNGLFIIPVDLEDPNWGTKWAETPESRVAVYKYSEGALCKFAFRLYIKGELVEDPAYKVDMEIDGQHTEYPLNSTIYFNEKMVVNASVSIGDSYRAKLIIGDSYDNWNITSSKGYNIFANKGEMVTTVITCTNEGGRHGTDIKWWIQGSPSPLKNRVTSPFNYFTAGQGRIWFEPADMAPEESYRIAVDIVRTV